MSHLPAIDPATATGPAAELFPEVRAALGSIPNFAKVMANSPAVLRSYLQMSTNFNTSSLPFDVRERVAIAVAEGNSCTYCLSAHIYFARTVAELPDEEIEAARRAESGDPRIGAILRLAAAINTTRGKISDEDVAEARSAGLLDEEIADIIGLVALNVLTNYFNSAADVEVDFPMVPPHALVG